MKKTLEEMIEEGRRIRNTNLAIDDGEGLRRLRRSEAAERCKSREEKDKLYKILVINKLAEDLVNTKKLKNAIEILDSLDDKFELFSQKHFVVHKALKQRGSLALLADRYGWTFAHEISRRFLFTPLVLPKQIFDVADKEGTTVRDVLTMVGFWIHDAEEEKRTRGELSAEHFLNFRSMGSYAMGVLDFLLCKAEVTEDYFGVQSNGEIEKILAERQNKKSFLSRIFLFR